VTGELIYGDEKAHHRGSQKRVTQPGAAGEKRETLDLLWPTGLGFSEVKNFGALDRGEKSA